MAESRFNKAQFQEWISRRDTQTFLRFLRDQRSDLMEQWAAGQDLDLRHQTKALLWGELAGLEWADYARHYDLAVEADEQA